MPIEGFEAGLKVRREVLGDEYVDRAFEGVTDFDREFQEFVTATAWGQVWTRDGLSRRDRSLLNLGMLAALGKSTELATHIRAGLGNGVTPDEISEVFRQVFIYCGAPAALEAMRIAKQVLRDQGVDA
ncbi:MAG: 4-carboxymuconolactone decarboxylase [Chloroflexi bacterium]|nr:4-carboxymuconolactone decarboxylase [Chloroflexota bacterium]